jgi:hypothetical protein
MENKIFAGKGAKYNELILKLLFEKGFLSPWKLANELALLDPKKPKDTYHKAQKIQSVLVRKNGRLEYLVKKEFIRKTADGYCLTVSKGSCSALVLFGNRQIPKASMSEFFSLEHLPPEFKDFLILLSKYNSDALKKSYKEVQDIANKLLDEGLNFEMITNQQFNGFFDAQYEQLYLERLRTGTKSTASAEWTPELQEAAHKFISRMVSIVQIQAKELQELSDKYAEEHK